MRSDSDRDSVGRPYSRYATVLDRPPVSGRAHRHNCSGRATVVSEMSTPPERRPSVLKALARAVLFLLIAGVVAWVLALVGMFALFMLLPFPD